MLSSSNVMTRRTATKEPLVAANKVESGVSEHACEEEKNMTTDTKAGAAAVQSRS